MLKPSPKKVFDLPPSGSAPVVLQRPITGNQQAVQNTSSALPPVSIHFSTNYVLVSGLYVAFVFAVIACMYSLYSFFNDSSDNDTALSNGAKLALSFAIACVLLAIDAWLVYFAG